MKDLYFFADPLLFQQELMRLLVQRRKTKLKKAVRKYSLSKATRKFIHQKTDGRCHICGCEVALEKFEADHVKAHSNGGENIADNFLPACKLCNNYRWHLRCR
jgi:predicted restriction endonuclease